MSEIHKLADEIVKEINVLEQVRADFEKRGDYEGEQQTYGRKASLVMVLAKLRAALAKDGWQPIETAPKDGSEILAYCVKYRTTWIAAWHPEFKSELSHWLDCSDLRAISGLTHWQPLPTPPPTE